MPVTNWFKAGFISRAQDPSHDDEVRLTALLIRTAGGDVRSAVLIKPDMLLTASKNICDSNLPIQILRPFTAEKSLSTDCAIHDNAGLATISFYPEMKGPCVEIDMRSDFCSAIRVSRNSFFNIPEHIEDLNNLNDVKFGSERGVLNFKRDEIHLIENAKPAGLTGLFQESSRPRDIGAGVFDRGRLVTINLGAENGSFGERAARINDLRLFIKSYDSLGG